MADPACWEVVCDDLLSRGERREVTRTTLFANDVSEEEYAMLPEAKQKQCFRRPVSVRTMRIQACVLRLTWKLPPSPAPAVAKAPLPQRQARAMRKRREDVRLAKAVDQSLRTNGIPAPFGFDKCPHVWVRGGIGTQATLGSDLSKLSVYAAQLLGLNAISLIDAIAQPGAATATATIDSVLVNQSLSGCLFRGGLHPSSSNANSADGGDGNGSSHGGDDDDDDNADDDDDKPLMAHRAATVPALRAAPRVNKGTRSALFLEALKQAKSTGAGTSPLKPLNPADRLHAAIQAKLDGDLSKRVVGFSGEAARRLERLVICVLLYHHRVVDEAVLASASLPDTLPSGRLILLWQAARKVRRWVAARVREAVEQLKARHLAMQSSASKELTAEAEAEIDVAAEEARLCAPLEGRASLLLTKLAPAVTPEDSSELESPQDAAGEKVSSYIDDDPNYIDDAGADAPLSPMRVRSAPLAVAAVRESVQAVPLRGSRPKMATRGSWDRVQAKLQLGNSADARWAGAREIVRTLGRRQKMLHRQNSQQKSIGGMQQGWCSRSTALDVGKYGQLTSEVLDFIEPNVRGMTSRHTPIAPLQAEIARRRSAVLAALQALEALTQVLYSPHEASRLAVVREMAMKSTLLRPAPRLLHGCGHNVDAAFQSALHALGDAMLARLIDPQTSATELRLLLQVSPPSCPLQSARPAALSPAC